MSKIKQIRVKRARIVTSNVQAQTVDPDNPPLSAGDIRSLKPIASIKRIRWQLGLSQEDFATRFEIPIGTLRDWEQGRSRPDRPARAYLKVIGSDPAFVSRALHANETTSVSASGLAAKALSNQKSLGRSTKGLAASALSQGARPPKSRKKKSS